MLQPQFRTSTAAPRHTKLYQSRKWRKTRLLVANRDLWTCQRPDCGRLIANESDAIGHHRKPHKGNMDLFFDLDNIEIVCRECHDSIVQAEERRLGYR